MPVDPRGLFDVYQEYIVQSLKEYRDAQIAIDEKVNFEITQDMIHLPELRERVSNEQDSTTPTFIPLVSVYFNDSKYKNGAVNKQATETCTYNIDMIVRAKGDQDELSEQVAIRRLKYLIQQVKNGLYRLDNSHFGKKISELGSKSWPTVNLFPANEDKSEESLIGATLSFSMDLPYRPPGMQEKANADDNDPINQLLEIISVDAKYFTTEYVYYVPE